MKKIPVPLSGIPASVFILSICLIYSSKINAQAQNSSTESKVDYLERIYFSGEDKEGLNNNILVTLQEIQEKQTPTTALAKQVTFLIDIQDKANAAKNACEVLDLLAVGIYNIDAAEAMRQGVLSPSDKAKAKSVDALASLNKLSSSSGNLSSTASRLSWNTYLLSGYKYGSFARGADKFARASGTVGNTLGAASDAVETGKDIIDAGKALGIHIGRGDNPCNKVSKKEIIIGEHGGPPTASTDTPAQTNTATAATTTTVISIKGISLSSLRILTDSLKSRAGVQSAEKSYTEALSTIVVMHSGTTDNLADWIEDKFSTRFNILGYSAGKIDLAIKQ